ncbi:hypothetical protein ACG873_16090 [Mesorhizobium sp. AaZ16]|jgi:hypothetical protein
MLQTSVKAGRQAFRAHTTTVRSRIETVVFAVAFGFTVALVLGLVP